MQVTATLRHLHIAPRKVRLAAHVIKGMRVEQAEYQLLHRMKSASPVLIKLIRSAVANARHNFSVEDSSIIIKDIRIDPGPMTKRFRARAFGRAATIRRRTSHVILVLETGSDKAMPGRGRGTGPIVREATVEDFRGEEHGARQTGEKPEKTSIRKSAPAGFIRRIFQRKAI